MFFQGISGTPVAQILCNKDRFDITQDKSMHCYLNNNSLINAKMGDTSFGPIVGLLVKSSLSGSDEKVIVKSAPSFCNDLKSLIEMINKSDQAKVQVLEDKPDEIEGNKPIEAKISSENLQSYQNKMKKFSDSYQMAVDLCQVLLKTDLPKTMWGAKEVKENLSKMKTASTEINKEDFEIAAEQTNFRSSHVFYCFGNRTSKVAEDSIDNIIANFVTMKKMMTSFIHSFHNLYASDGLFKKYTGYPATWFFDPSVFYNFTERYEDVSENLVEATRAESSVIRPLYVWKNKGE